MEIKCQLDATEVFIADLIACSTCFGHHYAHHRELKNVIYGGCCLWYLVTVGCRRLVKDVTVGWRRLVKDVTVGWRRLVKDVTVGWRRLCSDELREVYTSHTY